MTRRIRLLLIVLIAAGMLCACAPQVVVKPVTLPTVPAPALTPIKPAALQCLSDATYTTIVDRERKLKTWGDKQAAVITANNAIAGK